MFFKICSCLLIVLVVARSGDAATKKSWKSSPNFDTDIPSFTPFKREALMKRESEEVQPETPRTTSSPSPSAPTLTKSGKIRSKIRVPVHPDLKQQEPHNNEIKDFGKFDNNEVHDAETYEKKAVQEVEAEIANDTINIEQILGQLNDEADKASATTTSNSVDPEDDLEISSTTNEKTNVTQYKLGQLMNVTLSNDDNLVKVNLDQTELKQIFTGSSIGARGATTNASNFYELFIYRSRQEEQHFREGGAAVHSSLLDPIGRHSVHDHDDQAFPHKIDGRWQDRRSPADSRRLSKPPEQPLHEIDALALLRQGLEGRAVPAALPRATYRVGL